MNKINRPDLLAVDGGGSGCRVALVWQGIRLEATGGPANVFTDPEAGAAAIDEALRFAWLFAPALGSDRGPVSQNLFRLVL